MMFKQLLIIVAFFCMASCGKAVDSSQETPTVVTNTQDIKKPESIKRSEAIEKPEVIEKPEIITISKADEKIISEEKPTLNFNLPDDIKVMLGTDHDSENYQVLPNLFENKKDKKISIGGNIIIDPSSQDYIDSVKGAGVKIEIKTN